MTIGSTTFWSLHGISAPINGSFGSSAFELARPGISPFATLEVTTPGREHSGSQPDWDFNSISDQFANSRTPGSGPVPEGDAYLLSLGIAASDDDRYGSFDHIFVVPANIPVPEPSAAAIVLLASVGAVGLRRKRD